MRRLATPSIAASVVLWTACADSPAEPEALHEFEATVTGDVQMSLAGHTTVRRDGGFEQSFTIEDPQGRDVVAIVLQEGLPETSGHGIFLARLGRSFEVGTYAIGDSYLPSADAPDPVLGTFTEFLGPGGFKLFEMGGGELEITRVSDTTIRGSLTMHADEYVVLPAGRPGERFAKEDLENGPADLTITGTFTAPIARRP